jgi:hypothetical protein
MFHDGVVCFCHLYRYSPVMGQASVSIVLCRVISVSMSRAKCQQKEALVREGVFDLVLHVLRHMGEMQLAAQL